MKSPLLSGSTGLAPAAAFVLAQNARLWDGAPCGAPGPEGRTAADYGSTESAPGLPPTVSPVITLNPALALRVDLDGKEILLDTTLICIGTECLGEAARFQESRTDTPSFSLRWDPLPGRRGCAVVPGFLLLMV